MMGEANIEGTRGFTLVEVLLAMCIVCIGLLAVGGMQLSAIQANQSARKTTQANDWATLTVERLINAPYDDEELDLGEHEDSDNPRGKIFHVSWTVSEGPAVQTKIIQVTVVYPDRQTQKSVTLDFLKSNPDSYIR